MQALAGHRAKWPAASEHSRIEFSVSIDPDPDREQRREQRPAPRWRYLALAVSIFVLAGAILAGLWQLPAIVPGLAAGSTPTATASPTPTTAPSPTPVPTVTATPAITRPLISAVSATTDDATQTITFHLDARVPPGQGIDEVLLWYDTEAGHRVRRFAGSAQDSIGLNIQLDAAAEGLTRSLTTTNELDYWWLVRDSAGDSARAGGTVQLGPELQAQVVAPTPPPPPTDFAWSESESEHFKFYYLPDSAAERDLAQLADLAEASLSDIDARLQMDFDGQMRIYFVPRVFWQGGAAYGDKIQLISYLDRNYTGVETWSYFTHEGTHALAQDLIQPKKEGEAGPDGVLTEGLAVWASGGHYRLEPIDDWAALVAASEQYIPLAELRGGPFYDFQHEISYLEAASFVKFLVEHYGLDKFKELYGQADSDASHDDFLVHNLYGKDYAELEADWLAYLSGLEPTPEEAETWWLKVRTFDLMRRYETELDPDARTLPPKPPTEWTSDTLEIFMGRADGPLNVVLETALIEAQERLFDHDPQGAEALLDDVEAALDAGGKLDRPSLLARREILDLLAAQDRAVLRADAGAYRQTLGAAYADQLGSGLLAALQPPFTAYRQEVVRLGVADDGRSAQGTVLLHARLFRGDYADDGQLFAVTLARTEDGWLVTGRAPTAPILAPPPALDGRTYFGLPWPFPSRTYAAAWGAGQRERADIAGVQIAFKGIGIPLKGF